ncbi:MAG TPA: dihydrofolate reductase family protein [Polyangiaceae bacterium]|nr:dihydrofolate reductase family protein [Polyangiaceae bacterium]
MDKVVIDMTISLDGFVAGPGDGKEYPLGKNDGMRIFEWYFSGNEPYRSELFRPEPGANLDQVKLMYEESGAFIFGRRTYDITNGWGGAHPVNGLPIFVLTHTPPTAESVPKGPSNLTFVSDGIESAIRQARAVANGKDIKLGGASPGRQALQAGLCDEILIHLAPHLLGAGVRLFDQLGGPVRLEKIAASDGPHATHLRYRVLKA